MLTSPGVHGRVLNSRRIGLLCSGVCGRVVWQKVTDVSEESSTSTFRVEDKGSSLPD